MTHASLFSGIGGFDLAAEWMGWQNTFNCEIDPFCRKVLAYHFPDAKQYQDVKTTDFTIYRGRIDVLTGGFPCQPFSLAGKRKGADDNRYLWPEMLRAIREIKPRWVVGENVFGIVNWSNGMVFEQVQSDLENEGCEVQPFIIPACAVDAPHRRDRVWFVAHRRIAAHAVKHRGGAPAKNIGSQNEGRSNNGQPQEWRKQAEWDSGLPYLARPIADTQCSRRSALYEEVESDKSDGHFADCYGSKWNTPDSFGERLEGKDEPRDKEGGVREYIRRDSARRDISDFTKFPSKSPICGGDDGLSDRLDAITFPAWRRESIKAYGNAVVPQIPYLIFQTIETYEQNENLHIGPDQWPAIR